MSRSRTAAVSLTALLAVGGTTALTAGLAGAQVVDPPSSTTSTSIDPATTTTTVAPGLPTDVAITLPGLGDIALSVDPATGEIVSLTVTPIDGVTVADPIPVHHGVQLDFTLADGTVTSMIVEVHARNGAVKVEVEPADEEAAEHEHSGPPPVDQRGESAEHRNDDNDHSQGEHRGTSTTSTTVAGGAAPQLTAPPAPTRPRSDSDQSGRQGSGSQSGDRSGGRD